ncbi:odorant receptor 4-like [Chelonus insularis]|uniref:odorant receptor 4-like n=1 Tax=Chelonus insularis TaxID=460826 RepID=UPI00158C6E40|nr:odorant receptor 4-like [Chelonus insularis]
MSDNKLMSDYRMYRNIMEKLLIPIGMRSNQNPGFIIRCLPYIQTLLSVLMFFAIFGFVRLHIADIASVTRGLSIMITFATATMKMGCLIIYRKEMEELHEILNPYFNELLKKSNITHIILEQLTLFRRLTWTFLFFLIICGLTWNIIPLFSIISQYFHHVHPIHYNLIFPAVYPWNVSSSEVLFRFHFIFESFASISLVTVTASVNSLFPFYIFLMIGQLREFSYNISNTNEKNTSEKIIKKCVDQYCTIIKCRDNLQKIFGPIVLWIMCTNAVILCTVIFQITNMKTISRGRAFLFAAYTSLKFTEAFLFAWAGTCLTTESENWRDSIYNSNWQGNKRFMTSIIIMLTQKPIIVTACNFAAVSLDIFVMIVNTTISYFFLLRTIEHTD